MKLLVKISFCVVLGVLFAGVIAGRTVPSSGRPGSQAVYADLATETSCASLQAAFDRAETNGWAARNRGNSELGRVSTSYMQAADDRMREIGCY